MLTENALFVSNALSNAGAVGLMQVYPKIWLKELGNRFEDWDGAGLMRVRPGSADEAAARGVLVVPAGEGGVLMQATPPLFMRICMAAPLKA